MDEYRDLWDTTWQKLQKYSGKSLPHFISHKSHFDYAEFHMSTTWDTVQSVRLLVRTIEYNNYTQTQDQNYSPDCTSLTNGVNTTPSPAISVPLNGAAEVKCSSPTSRKSQQNRSALQRGVKKIHQNVRRLNSASLNAFQTVWLLVSPLGAALTAATALLGFIKFEWVLSRTKSNKSVIVVSLWIDW